MDLRQLKFFVAVAEHGSFTQAAQTLHIAQSAVSIGVKKLEQELGAELFIRRGRKTTLTVEGESLLENAKEIFKRLNQARQEIHDLRGLLKGEVQVGLTPMLSSFFFPKIISTFKRQYPALDISVQGDSAWNIQGKIKSGEIDIGIISGTLPDGLESHHLLREEVVACVHRYHPLARHTRRPLEELLRQDLIQFKKGYYLREFIDELAAQGNIEPRVMAETNLFTLVRSLVKEELGTAFLLKMAVAADVDIIKNSCDPPVFLEMSIACKK